VTKPSKSLRAKTGKRSGTGLGEGTNGFPREMADAMEIEAEAETTGTEQPTKADKAARR
jgi:hypothetical protein